MNHLLQFQHYRISMRAWLMNRFKRTKKIKSCGRPVEISGWGNCIIIWMQLAKQSKTDGFFFSIKLCGTFKSGTRARLNRSISLFKWILRYLRIYGVLYFCLLIKQVQHRSQHQYNNRNRIREWQVSLWSSHTVNEFTKILLCACMLYNGVSSKVNADQKVVGSVVKARSQPNVSAVCCLNRLCPQVIL
jgi:hypothetical protein